MFEGLTPEQVEFVKTACRDDSLFKQFVLADIFKRDTRCALHAKRLRRMETRQKISAAVGGIITVIGAWLAAHLLGKNP